jgi:hypothetical protein
MAIGNSTILTRINNKEVSLIFTETILIPHEYDQLVFTTLVVDTDWTFRLMFVKEVVPTQTAYSVKTEILKKNEITVKFYNWLGDVKMSKPLSFETKEKKYRVHFLCNSYAQENLYSRVVNLSIWLEKI